jgi:hypothetical protein
VNSSTPDAIDAQVGLIADMIVRSVGVEPTARQRQALVADLLDGVRRAERSYSEALGDAPIVLKLWACEVCGAGPITYTMIPPRCYEHDPEPGTQSLVDGLPMVASDYKPRKLPDGFLHLQSSMPGGVDKKFLVKLQRDLERSGEATVRLPEVGAHEQNARAVLRYVASKAGWHPERQGRIAIVGEGAAAMARWVYVP